MTVLKVILITLSLINIEYSIGLILTTNVFGSENNDVPSQETCNTVCSSQICNEQASFFLSIMNQDLDPCDDFYQFVCGNLLNKTIPENKLEISTFGTLQEKLKNNILREMKIHTKPDDLEAFKKIKMFYQNCMNETHIEEEGIKPYIELSEKLGGWPILIGNNWNESNYNWEDTLEKLNELGFRIFFPFIISIGEDSKNDTRHTIEIYPAATRISDSYFIENNKTLNHYFDLMLNISIEFGASDIEAYEQIKECIDFEIKLYKIKQLNQESKNDSTNDDRISISDLSQKYPDIPWLKILNQVFNAVNITINNTEIVEIENLKYFDQLKNILENTPKRTLANYQIWQIFSRMVFYMPKRIQERLFIFLNNTLHHGLFQKQNTETKCVYEVMGTFGIGVSAMYVKKYFNEDIVKNVTNLTNNIKNQFKNNLETIDWLDHETRYAALEKLDAMDVFIGYPNLLLNDTVINRYHKRFNINPGNFISSALNVSTVFRNSMYRLLRIPIFNNRILNTWLLTSVIIVNAFHSYNENFIEIPAGILQNPLFQLERPEYLNYGAIGSIIGHEITHGFDSHGREYDKKGNHINWWSSKSEEKFMQKIKCLIKKYDNYTIAELRAQINGTMTLDENIADFGGIKWSYQAYQKWINENNITEPCLPGLNYTPRQMFWISAASAWCGKMREKLFNKVMNHDKHSPSSARVVIPYSNMKEFSKDFNCKIGTAMNPENKCDLW